MSYLIEYLKNKESDPMSFLNYFRCTTEPIGGGTELYEDGELVGYDAAVAAIDIAKNNIINKAREWLSLNMKDVVYFGMNEDLYKPEFIQNFIKAMEE